MRGLTLIVSGRTLIVSGLTLLMIHIQMREGDRTGEIEKERKNKTLQNE